MSGPPARRRVELDGVIASAGFASGDRVVVGHWWGSPLGAFTDVMWARPDGTRVLLAPDERVLELVTGVYRFDEERVVALRAEWSGDRRRARLVVQAGELAVEMAGGIRWPVPFGGRAVLARWLHGPPARLLLGVHTYGVAPSGVEEWYRTRAVRRVRAATASVDGRDLGALGPLRPPLAVGVSEPPAWPSMVAVRPVLRWPAQAAPSPGS